MLNQAKSYLAAAADKALLGTCADVDPDSPFAPLALALSGLSVNEFVLARGILSRHPGHVRSIIHYDHTHLC